MSSPARAEPLRKAISSPPNAAPRRFVFLLLDRFTMINFAGAIEPLRLANHVTGRAIYEWKLCGEGGVDKTCSNGATLRLDMGLEELDRDDCLLVCGGVDIQKHTTKPVLAWLRRESRRGIAIGGLWQGCWMARRPPFIGKTKTGFPKNLPK